MSGWRFFVLKSPKVEPPSNSEMAHSYFLLRGRLAFVWRETHIVGWLATVGERSVLVIRPHLYRLNHLLLLALLWIWPSLAILSTFLGTALGRTIGISSPSAYL